MDSIILDVLKELEYANGRFPPFNSKNEAEDEIREHIKDQNEAFKRGYMDSKYRRSDYRAVRA